jgi:hypothetical protein
LSHGHVYAISPVIHNDSFEKVDFNINLNSDYKSYEKAKDAWFYWSLSFWGDHSTMSLTIFGIIKYL